MNTDQNLATTENETPVGKRRRPPREEDAARAGLKAERVQEMLRAMPEWRLMRGGKGLHRMRSFPSGAVAMLYVSFVTGFARAQGVPVYVHLYGRQVRVIVHAPLRRGHFVDLTERAVGFARRIA